MSKKYAVLFRGSYKTFLTYSSAFTFKKRNRIKGSILVIKK